MINTREFSVAIYGACRFAAMDRGAIQYFDNTDEAFWKSFNAAIFALPGWVLLTLLFLIENPVEASEFRILSVELIAYVIGWVLFPLVMVSFTEVANCGNQYFRFVAAWNWSAVLQVYFILAVTAFAASGSVGDDGAGLMLGLATLAVLLYQGFIACATLNVAAPVAALVVIIDLMLGFVIRIVERALY